MNNRPLHLTKSRFKLALECETKLYYTGKEEYIDKKKEDPFLQALAEGGFQVGELAKYYHEGGYFIETQNKAEALEKTNEFLSKKNCTIYEAAFLYQDLFIRADVLEKKGETINLIEVKAKSCNFSDCSGFLNKKGSIKKEWEQYVYDVAFQTYVLANLFPESTITPYLMLADKTKKATVDGLNQYFLITRTESGNFRVKVIDGLTKADLGDEILTKIDVTEIVETIFEHYHQSDEKKMSFGEWIRYLADAYKRDEKLVSPPGSKCKSCEFRCSPEEEKLGFKSGFKECWMHAFNLREDDFSRPTVLELWNSRKKDQYLKKNKIFIKDLEREDIDIKETHDAELSPSERQWLQIEKEKAGSIEPYIEKNSIRNLLETWQYPLHFIDFETSMVAIPFHKGLHPYEGTAFQYSHHEVDSRGKIAHKGEYLHRMRGQFPSFAFLRQLKKELSEDSGTIFRYAAHENSYLNFIYKQLIDTDRVTVPDRDELCDFIQKISRPTKSNTGLWEPGPRDMVDLRKVILNYIYLPRTNGSNSIKAVLPAILNMSRYIQSKYSKPIYGKGLKIESKNFENWQWVRFNEEGTIIDPYKLLPPVFEEIDNDDIEYLLDDSAISEGGAAMTAYAKMQFSEMSEEEEEKIAAALLKYCELDTFAMVLIWEYLREVAYGLDFLKIA